ncbi:MAG: hypothetical protein JWR44_834, partial [Hymenobacter sp.]|nr:hypothetical protein [Hymenobacter sp.]
MQPNCGNSSYDTLFKINVVFRTHGRWWDKTDRVPLSLA